MNGRYRSFRWAGMVLRLLAAVAIGVMVYNLGLARGLAEHVSATAPGPYPYPYPWHPWGFGPGLLFLVFGIVALRIVLWGAVGRRWHAHHACDGGRRREVPAMLEEWHRRMHERDAEDQGPPATSV
jgi:hypothetical protein